MADVPPQRAVGISTTALDPAGPPSRGSRSRCRTCSRPWEVFGRADSKETSTCSSIRLSVRRRLRRTFTPITMATVSEAIGLALPYSAGAPAPYEIAMRFCMTAGEQVMELIKAGIRPRDIVTVQALENAAAVVAASGGSTNAALHLPAIAHECGIKFRSLRCRRSLQKNTLCRGFEAKRPLCRQRLVRSWWRSASHEDASRSRLSARRVHDRDGRTIAENLRRVKWNKDQDVVRPANKPRLRPVAWSA